MTSAQDAWLRPIKRRVRQNAWADRVITRLQWASVSRVWPIARRGSRGGMPIDRVYIERFLEENRQCVTGRVLEIMEDHYGSRFGAEVVEVLDLDPTNPRADVIGDLCDPSTLAGRQYDAAVITQTLQYTDDPAAALRNVLDVLVPGGALLVTVPAAAPLWDLGTDVSDKWRWTAAGLTTLGEQVGADVEARAYGNSLTMRAFLAGLIVSDLDDAAFRVDDPLAPFLVGAVLRPGARTTSGS